MSTGNFKNLFIKAGSSETKERLRVQEVTRQREPRWYSALAPLESCRKESELRQYSAVSSPGK